MDTKKTRIIVLLVGAALLTCSLANIIAFNEKQQALSSVSAGIPFQKGMSFTTWTNSSFNTTATKHELDELRSIGVEWVAINHWWYQDYLNSTSIQMGDWSDTFANMTSCFKYARDIGLRVLYKPMLNLAKAYDWRSYIVFTPDWMANYTWWMVENAKAAQAGDVEILSIGTEMGNMQVHPAEVRQMIHAIRAVYDGWLTYSANHDSFSHVDWWDAVDVIGISMYSMMTVAWDPAISDLKAVWDGMYHELEELALKWNKPVAFTEIGIQARDGSNMIPNDNQISLERDVDEMRNYYISLFRSRIWTAPWFKGAYWWIWDYQDPATNPNLKDFNPALIKDTIEAEYSKQHVIDCAVFPVISAIVPLVAGTVVLVVVFRKSRSPILDRRFSLNPNVADGSPVLPETGASIVKDEVLLGIAIGSAFSITASSLTVGIYGVVQKSFSYAIILGLSTTETLVMFAALLLSGIFISLLLLRVAPRHVCLVAFLLLLVHPYLALGNRYQMLFVSTFLDVVLLFLSVAMVVLFAINCKLGNILRVILVSVSVSAGFFLLVLVFDTLAVAFLAIPVGIAIVLGQPIHLDEPTGIPPQAAIDGKKKRRRRFKTPAEMMLVWSSLLAGMVVPFGNSITNLVRTNFLAVSLHYVPALVVAGATLVAVMWWQGRGAERPRFDWARLFTNEAQLRSSLVLGLGGWIFILAGRLVIVWAFLSGMYLIQYLGTLVLNVHKGITRDNIGGGFAYLTVATICLVLGFLINAIKGLLVYVVTFLTIKGGAIVRRDPAIDPVATFDVPLALDGIVLTIVVVVASLLLACRAISRAWKGRHAAVGGSRSEALATARDV